MLKLDVLFQNKQIGKILFAPRTRMQLVDVHFPLMSEVQYFGVEAFVTDGTLEQSVAVLFWIGDTGVQMILIGMFLHLFVAIQRFLARTATFWYICRFCVGSLSRRFVGLVVVGIFTGGKVLVIVVVLVVIFFF